MTIRNILVLIFLSISVVGSAQKDSSFCYSIFEVDSSSNTFVGYRGVNVMTKDTIIMVLSPDCDFDYGIGSTICSKMDTSFIMPFEFKDDLKDSTYLLYEYRSLSTPNGMKILSMKDDIFPLYPIMCKPKWLNNIPNEYQQSKFSPDLLNELCK